MAALDPTPGSRFFDWGEMGRILAVITVFIAALRYLLTPFFDAVILSVLARNPERARSIIETVFAERIKKVDGEVSAVATLRQEVAMLSTSLDRNADELREQLGRLVANQTTAMEKLGAAVSEVHKEAEANARAVERIYGWLDSQQWNGQERRRDRMLPETAG